MRFSIIVPVYNVEKYISQCITSIINQTYKDFELILVNDGSNDKSAQICEEYSCKYENIVVLHKKNGGPTSARKFGVERAKGEYIICVDGDDYIRNDMLYEVTKALEQKPDTDIVCFGYYKDREGKISGAIVSPIEAGIYYDMHSIRERYLYDSSKIEDNSGCLIYSIWCKAIRRNVYMPCQFSIPDETKNGEDILLTAHALSRAKVMVVLDYAGYYYRENPNSLTHVRSSRDLINVTNVKNEIEKIGKYSEINIAHYYIYSVYILACDLAVASNSYSEFKRVIKSLKFDPKYSRITPYNRQMSIRQKMKFVLVQKKMWFVLFHMARKVRYRL